MPARALPCRFQRAPAQDSAGRDAALLVGFAPDGRPSPGLRALARCLADAGVSVHVCLAVTTDASVDPAALPSAATVATRENDSYDFGIWSAMLDAQPDLWSARNLIFLNDSVLIVNESRFASCLQEVLAHPADFVAMTENYRPEHHAQSFFFRLRGAALSAPGIRTFWREVPAGMGKAEVITTCEIPFLGVVKADPLLTTGFLFGYDRIFPGVTDIAPPRNNPTHHLWDRLLLKGMPFIKAELLHRNPLGVSKGHWRNAVAEAGGDIAMIERHLAEMKRVRGTPKRAPRPKSTGINWFLLSVLGPARFRQVRRWNRTRRKRRKAARRH